MASFKNHPAYKRALKWACGASPSYYFHVLRQNLHHFQDQVPSEPCEVDEQEVLRGTVFMVEEAIEYSSAKTLEGKFDALIDIVIVALGRAVFHGFHHFDEAMSRVIEANMRKVPGPSPRRGEWSRDLSKPEGWQPAYLSDLVQPSLYITDLAASSNEALSGRSSVLTETLRSVISLREKLKAQVFGSAKVAMSAAERDRMNLIREAEMVLSNVESLADSPLRTPVQADVPVSSRSSIELDQVHPVLLECAELLVKKSQDYGSSMTDYSKTTYMPFGHHSYIHMLHTKMGRIRSVAGVDRDRKQDVNFESLRDSVLDLINYAAFYGAWLQESEKTDVEERAR